MFIVAPTLEDADYDALMARIKSLIEEAKGKLIKSDKWEKQKLAYEINKNTDGIYTLVEFEVAGEQIAELNRVLRISDAVLRHTIVRLDK